MSDATGRGRKASRQMRIVTPDGVDPAAETKVPCPCCDGSGLVDAREAAALAEMLRAREGDR